MAFWVKTFNEDLGHKLFKNMNCDTPVEGAANAVALAQELSKQHREEFVVSTNARHWARFVGGKVETFWAWEHFYTG